jgi:hypothetical protein
MTDLTPIERRPGRPKGSRNKNRAATVESIKNMADPIGWQMRALKRGWVRGKGGVREYLNPDQKISLAVGLGRKVMADLRSGNVVGINVDGGTIQVITGIARSPTSPPLTPEEAERWQRVIDNGKPQVIDATPEAVPALPDSSGSQSASDSVTTSPAPDALALPAGRPSHTSSAPADAPWPALPSTSDPLADDNLDRTRAADARIAALNSRAAKFVA